MELLKEMLASLFEREEVSIVFPRIEGNIAEAIETQCYKALKKIKAIIENDSLSDFACVEAIVRVFEEMGSGGGNRHDFG